MNTQRIVIIVLTFILLPFSFATTAEAQDKKDPTADSNVIEKTLSKIRDVERLDAFLAQNKVLTAANKALTAELASIKKQIAKLNKDMTEQTAKLRRQLLQMPTFEVQSKILGGARNMALLKTKDKVIRIRDKTSMSVAVTDGVWVLMQVENITIDMIQLYFPELDRRVYLYD